MEKIIRRKRRRQLSGYGRPIRVLSDENVNLTHRDLQTFDSVLRLSQSETRRLREPGESQVSPGGDSRNIGQRRADWLQRNREFKMTNFRKRSSLGHRRWNGESDSSLLNSSDVEQ